jgi:hypothetical protein
MRIKIMGQVLALSGGVIFLLSNAATAHFTIARNN